MPLSYVHSARRISLCELEYFIFYGAAKSMALETFRNGVDKQPGGIYILTVKISSLVRIPMEKYLLNPDRLYEIGIRIERKNARKTRRSRLVVEKLSWHDLSPHRFRRLKRRAARLSRRLEGLESRRQDILRLLRVKWLKETDGIYG